MNRFIKIIVPAFLVSLLCLSFSSDTHDKLYWDERNQLAWSDFREVNTLDRGEKAIATTKIDIELVSFEKETAQYLIRARFSHQRSFVVIEYLNDYLLKHEQGHFDITEIIARKVRRELSTNSYIYVNFERDFKRLTNRYSKEHFAYQELYDSETNHSKNKENQEEWDKRIAKELEELKAYSDPVVYVTIR